jgi:hypothetical protein
MWYFIKYIVGNQNFLPYKFEGAPELIDMTFIISIKFSFYVHQCCHTRTLWWPVKKFINLSRFGKRTDIWHLVLFGKNVLFNESPPNIMVTRNPNWSTEILRYETDYAKGKILLPLKHPTWGKLHCWFCLKIAKSLLYYAFHGPPRIFLTLASVNNQLQIFPTLALINIAQPKRCNIPDFDASE